MIQPFKNPMYKLSLIPFDNDSLERIISYVPGQIDSQMLNELSGGRDARSVRETKGNVFGNLTYLVLQATSNKR